MKNVLENANEIGFQLPNGELVPRHFHVTEVGKITKHFIDCGGTIRNEEIVNFQLYYANDYDHRLHPEKLLKIINLSQSKLNIGDLEIEVEYQGESIQKFGLEFNGKHFALTTKHTDCLAKDNCGIPTLQTVKNLVTTQKSETACCAPGSGCC